IREFLLQQRAGSVEVITIPLGDLTILGSQTRSHRRNGALGLCTHTTLVQEFAEGPRAGLHDGGAQAINADGDLAILAILIVRPAVGFKSAPLVEMEEGATDFMQPQFLVERACAQGEWIKGLKRLALAFALGKKSGCGEMLEQGCSAAQKTIPPPTHGAGIPAIIRERSTGFGIAPIAENARARRMNANRLVVPIQNKNAPTQ
ncbi:MAG: hypothetical protein INF11_15625, partial [Methylobacterium sp.]|nr:hypothetical protein [Methylobacterium sp.]